MHGNTFHYFCFAIGFLGLPGGTFQSHVKTCATQRNNVHKARFHNRPSLRLGNTLPSAVHSIQGLQVGGPGPGVLNLPNVLLPIL